MEETRPSQAEVLQHFGAILESELFSGKSNANRLLQFLVNAYLRRPESSITRKEVHAQCFPGHEDIQIVSTEKSRLIKYLQEFYATEGRSRIWRFVIARKSFDLSIEPNGPTELSSQAIVGRSNEMRMLSEQLESVLTGGFGVSLIEGTPGIGKTLLIRWHTTRAQRDHLNLRVVWASTEDEGLGEQAYRPFELATRSLVENTGGPTTKLRERLHAMALGWERKLFSDSQEVLSALQLTKFLTSVSSERTTIIVLEDVHRAEHSSLRFLESLMQARPQNLQIILSYRFNELTGANEKIISALRTAGTQHILLTALSKADIKDFFERRFIGNTFGSDFVNEMHALSGGIPIYLDQLAQRFKAEGIISRDGGKAKDRWQLKIPLNEVIRQVPENVVSFLAGVYGRLPLASQDVILAAALQGEEFESVVVADVIGLDAMQVESMLKDLADQTRLLTFVGSSILPAGESSVRYRFLHALYLRAALSLFEQEPTRYRRWSGATANAILRVFPDDPRWNARIANLMFIAGRYQESLPRFIEAAQRALISSNFYTCQKLSRLGLEAADHSGQSSQTDQAAIALLGSLAMTTLRTKGYADPDMLPLFNRAIYLAGRNHFENQLPPLLFGLWIVTTGQGKFRESMDIAQNLIQVTKGKETNEQSGGWLALGLAKLHLGKAGLGYKELKRSVDVSGTAVATGAPRFAFHIDERIASRCQAARAALFLCKFAESRKLVTEALDLAESIGHPHELAYARTSVGTVSTLSEDFIEARALFAAVASPAAEYGLMQEQAWSAGFGAYAAEQINPGPGNRALCQAVVNAYDAAGASVAGTELKARLAACYVHSGETEAALTVIESATQLGERTGEQYFWAELLRLRGEVMLLDGRGDEAMNQFRASLSISQKQGATLFELNTLISLTKMSGEADGGGLYKDQLSHLLQRFPNESNGVLNRARAVIQ